MIRSVSVGEHGADINHVVIGSPGVFSINTKRQVDGPMWVSPMLVKANGLLVVALAAVVAGWETIDRFFHPVDIRNAWLLIATGLVGFVGNEIVAIYRMRMPISPAVRAAQRVPPPCRLYCNSF
ncbi:hypothetical protein GCM10028798_29630 [Humibacter antri]